MGGDLAPQAAVVGSLAAARALPHLNVILVGEENIVRTALAGLGDVPANLTVHHASQVVEMCDAPAVAVRQKRDSSIAVGMRLVRDGKAHGFVSAGNSGAMMAAATLVLKLQPGVDRPAIAVTLPSKTGVSILLDAGATTDCKPANLVQFAHLGTAYASILLDKPTPRVGLLSIGEEPSKGDELTKDTHQLLLTSGLNFVGNVEPKEIIRGEVDVTVCDGFVGNLILKATEGLKELIEDTLKQAIYTNWLTKLAGMVLRPALRTKMKKLDYAQYGGALLLGVNGIVVISHGRSTQLAMENAVKVAARAAERQLGGGIAANA